MYQHRRTLYEHLAKVNNAIDHAIDNCNAIAFIGWTAEAVRIKGEIAALDSRSAVHV